MTVEEPGHLSNAEMCVLPKGVFRDWGLEIGRSLEFGVAEACQHRGLITCLKGGGTLSRIQWVQVKGLEIGKPLLMPVRGLCKFRDALRL